MDDRSNTISGWVLAGLASALGLSIASGMYFHAERPEKMGYPIEGVEAEGGAAAAQVDIATLLPTASAAKGAEVFKKCAACHTITQGGPNGIGPNLYATMGEPIGQGKGGYPFSDALKGVGGNWDFEKMSRWLESPRKFAPGTKMTFAGLSAPQDRADLLVYMNAQGSNLPLPAAAPAADPAVAGAPVTPSPSDEAAGTGAKVPDTKTLSNTAAPASGAPSVDQSTKERAADAEDGPVLTGKVR